MHRPGPRLHREERLLKIFLLHKWFCKMQSHRQDPSHSEAEFSYFSILGLTRAGEHVFGSSAYRSPFPCSLSDAPGVLREGTCLSRDHTSQA